MIEWEQNDYYEVTCAVGDLMFGDELPYESYYPSEFLLMVRRKHQSDRESTLNLMKENAKLKAFQSAVVGWREKDHPEGFSRKTAEYVADLGRVASGELKQ